MGFMKKTKVITQKVIQPLDDGTMPTYVMYAMSVEKGTFFDGIIHVDKTI